MATQTLTLTDSRHRRLIVQSRKSRVALLRDKASDDGDDLFDFGTRAAFKAAAAQIKDAASHAWTRLAPRDAESMASNYDEYYDKALDNNGGLALSATGLIIKRPYDPDDALDPVHLYIFNKRKMETFLYDLIQKHLI